MSRSVAVLRPEPGNSRTAAAVEAMGLDAIRLPLFTVFPVAWSPPEPDAYDAIVATSANAFRHGGTGLAALTALPVLAVGAATAAAARAAGFAVTATGERDAASLVAEAHGRLLHLAGREHRPVAGAATRIVYATGTTTVDAARLATLAGQVALIHSPRAAARLADTGAAGGARDHPPGDAERGGVGGGRRGMGAGGACARAARRPAARDRRRDGDRRRRARRGSVRGVGAD